VKEKNAKTIEDNLAPELNGEDLDVSVIVPISERHDDLCKLYRLYSEELARIGKRQEWIFVVDGHFPAAQRDLKKLKTKNNPIRILQFSKPFGESAALIEGIHFARSETLLTLASYIQIEPDSLDKLFHAYGQGNDMVITRRFPRRDPIINRIQSWVYHAIMGKMTGIVYKDITSGMRLMKRRIISEFALYGDLHRFLPIMALQRGFSVAEIKVQQRREDTKIRLVSPGVYLRRFLDILTIFFLIKFTQKPLRFFGLIGSFLFIPGALITISLGVGRIFFGLGLADRPLLLLAILLMVFGIQILSVGLVGELIIFGQTKAATSYRIAEINE